MKIQSDNEKLIDRQIVQSSMFASIGYDEDNQILQVEFKNGDVWNYTGVPFDVYTNMMDSDSIGKYFLSDIKGKYETEKL